MNAHDTAHSGPPVNPPPISAVVPAPVVQRPGVIALLGIDPAQLAALDVGKLTQLVELHRSEQARLAAEAYAQDMRLAQEEMKAVIRDTHSEQTNRKYAPLETVHRTNKAVWLRRGFSLSFSEEKPDIEGQCKLGCTVFHVGGHSTRHTLEGALDSAGMKGGLNKTPIQAKVSSSTYLRRCLEVLIFDLTLADADKDGAPATKGVVGPAELKVLNKMLADVAADAEAFNVPFSREKFLAWLGVEDLAQLPMRGFTKAISDLQRKQAQIKEPQP